MTTLVMIAEGSVAAVDNAGKRSVMLGIEGGDAAGTSDDNERFCRSFTNALTPCWVPLTKSGPRAVVSLSGGKNPNGVGISAGLVDQPKFGSP